MKKIKIIPNINGDTRTAPSGVTFKQFHKANKSHIKEVNQVMQQLAKQISIQGKYHDWTKIKYEKQFYEDFIDVLTGNKPRSSFVQSSWYNKHIHLERHHPKDYCAEDLNLLDVIETIVDCICAGKARSGKVGFVEFTPELLKTAVTNTAKLINNLTEIEDKK